MRDPKLPFAFPDRPDWPPPFPASVATDTAIVDLVSWWLEIKCDCEHRGSIYPLRLLCAEVGWQVTIGQVLARLKCKGCRREPVAVTLIEDTVPGRYRAGGQEPEKLLLKRYR